MRTFSANFRKALMSEDSEEVPVFLVTISHPELDQDYYASSDTADVLDPETEERGTISRGQAFGFVPMGVKLPDEGDGASVTCQLVLYEVASRVSATLRSTTRPALVTIELVLASAPDYVEAEYPFFELTEADIGAGDVVLTLNVDVLGQEPYPAPNFTPATFGGLWAST